MDDHRIHYQQGALGMLNDLVDFGTNLEKVKEEELN